MQDEEECGNSLCPPHFRVLDDAGNEKYGFGDKQAARGKCPVRNGKLSDLSGKHVDPTAEFPV
ncbi:hypothetical protein K040078D81_38030 [Blautia hominis]|uniref:Uncharacterized protein n=1 Tax=Blautia hominis TaxID=2025493 RepID=A0ABQ0BE29_9FIRM